MECLFLQSLMKYAKLAFKTCCILHGLRHLYRLPYVFPIHKIPHTIILRSTRRTLLQPNVSFKSLKFQQQIGQGHVQLRQVKHTEMQLKIFPLTHPTRNNICLHNCLHLKSFNVCFQLPLTFVSANMLLSIKTSLMSFILYTRHCPNQLINDC